VTGTRWPAIQRSKAQTGQPHPWDCFSFSTNDQKTFFSPVVLRTNRGIHLGFVASEYINCERATGTCKCLNLTSDLCLFR
jgi:hypothetical protein